MHLTLQQVTDYVLGKPLAYTRLDHIPGCDPCQHQLYLALDRVFEKIEAISHTEGALEALFDVLGDRMFEDRLFCPHFTDELMDNMREGDERALRHYRCCVGCNPEVIMEAEALGDDNPLAGVVDLATGKLLQQPL